jgi:hypothetical protein
MFLRLNNRSIPGYIVDLKVARRFAIPLILAMVGVVGLVIAASNVITLNHTATVTTGATLGVIDQGGTAPASCPLTGYGPGPVSIGWGNVPQGSTVKHYLCVINSGTAPETITLTGNPPTGYGTITSPQASTSLLPGSTLSVELDWAVPVTATPGAVPNFSTSIA